MGGESPGQPNDEAKASEWSENLDGFHNTLAPNEINEKSPIRLIRNMTDVPALLILIGVLTALVTYWIRTVDSYGAKFRRSLVGDLTDPLHYILYTIFCVGMGMVSCFITQLICPEAVGGGLPEMKTILSGTIKPVLLSGNLLIAKSLGLTFTLLSGVAAGKEGPFVHISAAIG